MFDLELYKSQLEELTHYGDKHGYIPLNKIIEVLNSDNEELLDVAVTKGLDVRLMDREGVVSNSKYKVINNLEEFF